MISLVILTRHKNAAPRIYSQEWYNKFSCSLFDCGVIQCCIYNAMATCLTELKILIRKQRESHTISVKNFLLLLLKAKWMTSRCHRTTSENHRMIRDDVALWYISTHSHTFECENSLNKLVWFKNYTHTHTQNGCYSSGCVYWFCCHALPFSWSPHRTWAWTWYVRPTSKRKSFYSPFLRLPML